MLNLHQQLRLQQKLSPQQIQYVKLLQLPVLALEQRVEAELEANPVLEPNFQAEPPPNGEAEETPDADEEYNWEELLNVGDDLHGHKARVDRSETETDRPAMPALVSLTEHLRSQWGLLNLTDLEALIAEQIIGSIDEDGYLRRPLASIMDDIIFNHGEELEEADIERVLQQIQRLDPAGIAARNLRECLLVQVDMLPNTVPGQQAAKSILDQAFEDFAMRRFGRVQSRIGAEPVEMKLAIDLIQNLNPKPGEGSFTAQENYIVPDFTVRYDEACFHIELNGGDRPALRISPQYRKMLEELTVQDKSRRSSADERTRQFLKAKFTAARWFIDSINQRRRTLFAVMEALVDMQRDFFRYGQGRLRPLILKDVAERTNLDISTVSRVVNGKYVQCDFGVYELKYFFSEGLETADGKYVSSREVKATIESIIRTENKARPLSDQKIAQQLQDRGFRIARRTVTKYREQLNIPVGRMRREFVPE